MSLDYTQFGGTLIAPDHPQGEMLCAAPEPTWNFGLIIDRRATNLVKQQLVTAGNPISMYDASPGLRGIGEGQTVILHHVVREIPFLAGKFLQSQYQPRGTCVSRGAKRIADLCQGLAIRFGSPYEFDYISHAYIYGSCREHGNFLSWNSDGAVGAWAAWTVANDGSLRNKDVGDDDNLDDLAVKWGAQKVPEAIKVKGRIHLIRKVVPINTFEEARDWICSGQGGVTVASNVGYVGQRDSRGVVRRSGRWNHQMCFTGYRHDLTARGALLQDNSWGPNQPGGPIGDVEIPSYSWWTLADDCDVQIHQQDSWGFKFLDSWDAQDVTYRP